MRIKNILIVILLLILNSCQKNDGLKSYDLDALGAVIQMPGSLKPVNAKVLKRLKYLDDRSEFKEAFLKFRQSNPRYEFLIDTLKPFRFTMVGEITPYVKVDSNAFYFIIDHERSQSSSHPNVNDSTYYFGSKMGSIVGFKFLESKYQRTLNSKKLFSYSYMISSDTRTMGIAFYSPEEQDVRQFINSVRRK